MSKQYVYVNLTVHARGEMATKLLEAAEELGLPVAVVKTTSEGFRVPVEIHRHLFPSAYNEDGTPDDQEVPEPVGNDVPELSNDELSQVPGVQDFQVEDLTDDELDDLTDPSKS